MPVRLVTYDLNKEVTRPKIVTEIKKSPGWAKLSESSYAISSSESVEQIYKRLKPFLDGNDQLYVINLTKPWDGQGLKEVNEWLENNLPSHALV